MFKTVLTFRLPCRCCEFLDVMYAFEDKPVCRTGRGATSIFRRHHLIPKHLLEVQPWPWSSLLLLWRLFGLFPSSWADILG